MNSDIRPLHAVFAVFASLCLASTAAFAQSYGYMAQWGSLGTDTGQFSGPFGVATDSIGDVYVADSDNHRIQKFTSTGSFLLTWGSMGAGPGEFLTPASIASGDSGFIYVTDVGNHRVQKFTSTGAYVSEWGQLGTANGEFIEPLGVAVDGSGAVYVTDGSARRVQKFTSAGAFVTQWGDSGNAPGQFQIPIGITVDWLGFVYVTDAANHRVQKFDPAANFVAEWGSAPGPEHLETPAGIAINAIGNVVVTDVTACRVVVFTPSGVFRSAFGSQGIGNGEFEAPAGVAVGRESLYVSDYGNNRIQVFRPIVDVQPAPPGDVVVWVDHRYGHDDLYAQRIDDRGHPQWNPQGVLVCGGPADENVFTYIPDDSGGVYVAWEDHRASDSEIYMQHIDAYGLARWGENGMQIQVPYGFSGRAPLLVGDGAGGVIVAWENRFYSNDDTNKPNIYLQRLDSNGFLRWTSYAVAVTSSPDTPERHHSLATDGAGGAFVAWTEDTKIYAQHITAAGQRDWGDTAKRVGLSPANQSNPEIVGDGTGGVWVAYSDLRAGAGNSNIYAQRLDTTGVSVGAEITVCAFARNQTPFRMVSDGEGGGICLWRDERDVNGTRVFAKHIFQDGTQIGTIDGIQLSFDDLDEVVADTDGAGGAYVAWTQITGDRTQIHLQRYRSDGGTWATSLVCPAFRQVDPFVLHAGNGDALVSWTDDRTPGENDVYAQRYDSTGIERWVPCGTVRVHAGHRALQLEPSSVSDGAGGVILAWIDDRFDYWRVYIKRIDAAGHDVWNSVWVAEGVGPQRRPLLVSDGAYGAIVVCETHGVEPNTTELLAQRIDASGARRWGSNGVTVATDVVPGAAVTTSDEDRGVIVAWSAGAGLELNLYAQRLDSTGVAMWPAPGVAVCVAPSLQFQMAIAPDGASGAIVTWSDLRTSDYNIFAQRISAGGQAVWDPDGLALCNAGQAQLEPTIVADQSGGAIIAWMDYRSVDAAAIYAQRVSTDGITRWTPNGLLLSNGTDNQFYPVAVTDGVSGVIVTWLSAGSAPAVIAQHVYATGFLAWQPGGVVLGSTSGQSGRPAAVPDGGGGVIAAWMEAPTAVRNVVIERLRADGVPLWAQNVAAGAWEQQAPILAPAEHGNAIVAWEDWRVAPEELYLQKFGDAGALWEVNGGRTPTLVSLASATAAPDLAQVRWHLGDPAMDVTIERWTTESGWQTREAHARADGTGFVSIDDRDIVAGLRYGYRLSWIEDGIARFGGEVFVDVPAAFALALERAWPNPALHELHVALTLPSAAPAALELIDLSGRRVLERTVARAGRLTVTVLEGRSIEPGVYFLRLRQGGASVYRKISVIR